MTVAAPAVPGGASRQLGWARALLIVLVAVALYLPGLSAIPPLDRDEARFAQATRQMLASGDLIDIRFQDEARYRKPVGIYWLQAASVAILGPADAGAIWPYRVPSFLAAILAALLTARIGARLFGAETGLVAGLLFAATILIAVEARIAKTDAVLLACILAAIERLAQVWQGRDRGEVLGLAGMLAFWGALGAGILVKGPVAPLVVGLAALALALSVRGGGWLRALRPAPGLLVALAIVLPWLVAILVKSRGGFIAESVGHDLLGKLAGGQESKGFPLGFYVLAWLLTFWPATGALLAALPWIWRNRRHPGVNFCLAWAIPVWVVFEAVPTKLLHYVLPAYPALAIMAAAALLAPVRGVGRAWRVAAGTVFGGGSVVLAAALPGIAWQLEGIPRGVAIGVGAALLIGLAGAGWWAATAAAPRRLALILCAGAAGVYATVFAWAMPRFEALWISPRVAAAVARVGGCPAPRLVAAGYAEPSLVFLAGTDTRLVADGGTAAAALVDAGCALALVERREADAFAAALARQGRSATEVARIEGLNYSRGKWLSLGLYRADR